MRSDFMLPLRILFISLFLTLLSVAYGQDSAYIKSNAIKIERQDSLDETIYKAIAPYQLFMIGESHGTKEPARFATSLTHLFINKGYKVQIGLEISSQEMKRYLSNPIDSNIYLSDFFARKRQDARGSYAWADLIAQMNGSKNVELFFFDPNYTDRTYYLQRDSLMYVNLKSRIQLHPEWKTITISGNIHNLILPYNGDGKSKMGMYILNDKDLNFSDRVLSICHAYESGTDWTLAGDKLQVIQITDHDRLFAKSVDYNNYLLLLPKNIKRSYNAYYFTRQVTAAKLVSQQ